MLLSRSEVYLIKRQKDVKVESEKQSTDVINFTEESDYDLLEIMTWKDNHAVAAKEAWAEFYRRHIDYVYGICSQFCKSLGGDATAQDLAAETIKRVYESGARTFKQGPSQDKNQIRIHVRSWLGRIVKNLIRDAFSEKSKNGIFWEIERWQKVSEKHKSPPSEKAEIIARIMQTVLNEREQYVLRIRFHWKDLDKNNQRLPDDVVAELAIQLNTTPENIRQIACRAMKKIKTALNCQKGTK